MADHYTNRGLLARFDGYCARCDQPFHKGVSQIVRRGPGRWIHAECSSGADDE